jgi:hypothetical protein
MQERNREQQDQRTGGYGDSTGGQRPQNNPAVEEEASAGGREGPPTSTADADEALGNRTGGYGGNPSAEEAERGS